MRAFIGLLLSGVSLLSGETLVPLKSGETNMISYGLSCLVSDSRAASNAPAGSDLILVLRNTGAKWIDLDHVSVEDFRLQDAKGQEVKIYLWSSPRGMAYGSATVIHLGVDRAGDAPQPWTLHFRSKPKAFVPVELTIPGIKPHRR